MWRIAASPRSWRCLPTMVSSTARWLAVWPVSSCTRPGCGALRELGARAQRTDDPALGTEVRALKLALEGLREAGWEMPADGALAEWLEASGPVAATMEPS